MSDRQDNPLISDRSAASHAALRRVLRPLARLALAHGVQHRTLDELLRQALVEEASRLVLTTPRQYGRVSRISTATGLSRREVSRLLETDAIPPQAARSLASEVFTRWRLDPAYQEDGRARVLPCSGEAPSFEALARSVTQDVHPRSLLDELCRLDLASVDAQADTVTLHETAYVPRADADQMVALLGDNVSDHLDAAVTNVLGRGDEHFEQALYADELSAESVRALRPLIAAEWAHLFAQLAPQLEQLLADDEAQGRPQDQRVRIGFYSFAAPMGSHGTDIESDTPPSSLTPP